ncbi:MAG: hypothetical protein ACPF8V_12220, partial [Luteibaculum sp.]
ELHVFLDVLTWLAIGLFLLSYFLRRKLLQGINEAYFPAIFRRFYLLVCLSICLTQIVKIA